MEPFMTTVIWTLILSGYFQQKSAVDAFSIRTTSADIQCPPDSTFYAPDYVEERCIASALDCAMSEVNGTVRAECDGSLVHINQVLKSLKNILRRWNSKRPTLALPKSGECVCEAWPLVSFSRFLLKIKNLTELVNSAIAASP